MWKSKLLYICQTLTICPSSRNKKNNKNQTAAKVSATEDCSQTHVATQSPSPASGFQRESRRDEANDAAEVPNPKTICSSDVGDTSFMSRGRKFT